MKNLNEMIVLIKGAGEVASGIAHRLHRSHFKVCMTEIEKPLAVSRGTCFSEAVWDGLKMIEGVTAERVDGNVKAVSDSWGKGSIPLVIDPGATIRFVLKPDVIIDATMTKKTHENMINDAPLVIGIGPGFYVGRDAHLIVESFQNNDLGKVLFDGEALADNGQPVEIGGLGKERVIWASQDGLFTTDRSIGDNIEAGEIIARIGNLEITAPLKGWLRGLLRSDVTVSHATKLIEIDHVNTNTIACDIRNKMRAIAGGVLEAIMIQSNGNNRNVN
jgi:xanthine dehydrogenase accessory factor